MLLLYPEHPLRRTLGLKKKGGLKICLKGPAAGELLLKESFGPQWLGQLDAFHGSHFCF